MQPIPDERTQPETFPLALAFVVALLPVLMLVFTFLPDGSECATAADTTSGTCGYWFTQYTSSTLLIALGATATLIWLIFGLPYFVTRLLSLTSGRARNAVFFYAILTCAICFLILPTAIVTVLIVFVFSEIVLRLSKKRER